MELCKTRNKKSRLDMFNCYVELACHDMISDVGRAELCSLNFKSPSLSTKPTKNEGPFENMSFSKKPFEDFNEKSKTHF